MARNNFIFLIFMFSLVTLAMQAHQDNAYTDRVPGKYFWRPHMGIDLAIPTTKAPARSLYNEPNLANVHKGLVVLVNGYQMGLTVMGIATGLSATKPYPHLNPMTAHYNTNIFRWSLRYVSLLPFWAGGNGGHIAETHRVWKRRFYYMDEQVPRWLRWLVPQVKEQSWDDHELEHKRFKAYAEAAFGKHYRYPSKVFKNFRSFMTEETKETIQIDSV